MHKMCAERIVQKMGRQNTVKQAEARAKGPETQKKRSRVKKTTERHLLKEMLTVLEQDPSALKELTTKMLGLARAGDKDAAAFIGKYLLGGGKIALDELYHPPAIRPSRR